MVYRRVTRFAIRSSGSRSIPRSNSVLFPNLFPDEATPPHLNQVSPSYFLRVRGAQWFDYVVLADSLLIVGERVVGHGHANLAQGRPVRAAGQVNASGHDLPTGRAANRAAIRAFSGAGFLVTDRVYVEKSWNIQLQLCEPSGDDQ